MSLDAAIYNRLQASAGIAAIVGTRVYPHGQAPQDAPLPMLIHECQNANRPGILNGRCPLMNYQVRVTAFAMSASTLRDLMDKVRDALDIWKDGRVVMSSLSEQQSNPNPEAPELYSESHVYSVWYQTDTN